MQYYLQFLSKIIVTNMDSLTCAYTYRKISITYFQTIFNTTKFYVKKNMLIEDIQSLKHSL